MPQTWGQSIYGLWSEKFTNPCNHQLSPREINESEMYQFWTRLELNGQYLDVVQKAKLLGFHITNDLKWDVNTESLVKRANKRMELLRKVSSFGTSKDEKRNIYILFIRSILEQSATVWHSSLTEENVLDLERVQKSAVKLILKDKYRGYQQGLAELGLENLRERREQLCLEFAKRCARNEKLKHMFPINNTKHQMQTRKHEKYLVEKANTKRFQNSAIIYMQRLLNRIEAEKSK